MNHSATTNKELRERRHARVRSRVSGTSTCPRLAVYKSNRFMSVQLIDDEAGKTIASVHGREFSGTPSERAIAIGKAIAERAQKADITKVVFDRGGFRYAASIKTLADTAREGGLIF